MKKAPAAKSAFDFEVISAIRGRAEKIGVKYEAKE